ncbi:MAG TPA: DUF4112 domain-containing protein [Nitrospiraceae bacterium]|jgi:hypothetical protein|nr:DUF4112 domain-containing protein [Nitrospiraceae bacterium]
MALVRSKEMQAELIAHLLDDVVRIPGTRIRFGADPLLGLIPILGDPLATVFGGAILVIARRLQIPQPLFLKMCGNMLVNGMIGAVPFVGDAFSFAFKSNARNTALLLRAVKRQHADHCPLDAASLTLADGAWLAAAVIPTLVLSAVIGSWFWQHDISYFTLLFPPPYRSR